MGQEKGVMLFDTVTRKKEFIEIKGTPKHYRFTFDANKNDLEILGGVAVRAHDYIEVAVVGDAEKVKFVTTDTIRDLVECNNITLDRQGKEKHFSRLEIKPTEILDQKSLMKKYVDFIDTDLDRKKLMEIGESIVAG